MLRRFVSKKSITPNVSISDKKNNDNVFSDFINEYIELLKKTEPNFYQYIIIIEPKFPIIPYTKKSSFCVFNKDKYITPRNNNSTPYLINLNLFISKTKIQYQLLLDNCNDTPEIKTQLINFIPNHEKNEFDDIQSINLHVNNNYKPKPLLYNKQTINPTSESLYSEEEQLERIHKIYGYKRTFNL
jgi:hypothetical protein